MRVTVKGLEPVWETIGLPEERFDRHHMAAHDGFVYLTAQKETWAFSTKDGKAVGKVAGVGGQATHAMVSVEDLLFVFAEGRHGGTPVQMLRAAGPDTQVLNADITRGYEASAWIRTWTPRNPTARAYAERQLLHPIVDGRLFMRGADGIYCYDLRVTSKSPPEETQHRHLNLDTHRHESTRPSQQCLHLTRARRSLTRHRHHGHGDVGE
jgi:hypothetical protein